MKWISDRKLTIVLGLVLGAVMMLLQMSHFDVILPEDFGFLLPCFSYWLAAIVIAMGGGALMGATAWCGCQSPPGLLCKRSGWSSMLPTRPHYQPILHPQARNAVSNANEIRDINQPVWHYQPALPRHYQPICEPGVPNYGRHGDLHYGLFISSRLALQAVGLE